MISRRLLRGGLLAATLFAAAPALLPATAHAEKNQIIDRIVAKINDDIITLNDLKRASGPHLLARRLTREQLDADPNAEAIYREILNDMINTQLLAQEAGALQLQVTEEDVDQWIQGVIQSESATEEDFREELRLRGVRWQDYRRYIKESLLKVRVVQVKVASRVTVPEAEVEQAYLTRFGSSAGEGIKSVDVSYIHIPWPEERDPQKVADVEALVARVMKDLNRGRPFADVAKEASAGPQADTGGHLGRFRKGDMRAEYDTIYDTPAGDYTDPIQTETGYHIFRVNEVFTERDPKVDSRLDAIRNKLLTEARTRELNLWLEALRKRAYVKVML